MDIKKSQLNAKAILADLDWLHKVIQCRFQLYWNQESPYQSVHEILPPDLSSNLSPYAKIVIDQSMDFDERLIFILSLAQHVQPQLLDIFFTKNSDYNREFTEFGGVKGKIHNGFIPTGETAVFILSGNSLEHRFRVLEILDSDHFFFKKAILTLEHTEPNEPFFTGILNLSIEYLNICTHGNNHKPDYNSSFPAKLIDTNLDWSDLVVSDEVFDELEEIKDWIAHGNVLLNDWGLIKKIKPGYRALFFGPPGTGKTLTACLLGKYAKMDVYRIDLSMIVSKYIGETEKNLGKVFDQAMNKNWILFFDEADSLFGKRTQTSSSNDRFANQEVSYLLQKIEDFPGIIVLATNLKANMDDAFSRRFQNMVYFTIPDAKQREVLWKNAFSKKSILDKNVLLEEIADKYEIAGGSIINVIRYCSLKALKRNDNTIKKNDIITGIKKELLKEGKTI
jgi:adenylate kinase family enzyme